ncbi:transposase [Micromonospora ureilytica]|uniref:transposase n=1 Tax=Micromonospora ureilytica TaxID=709868 RepID=UPI00340A463E
MIPSFSEWTATSFPNRGSYEDPFPEGERPAPRKCRNYSPEYRTEVVKRVLESSRPVAQVAREFGARPCRLALLRHLPIQNQQISDTVPKSS